MENRYSELAKCLDENMEDDMGFFDELFDQFSQPDLDVLVAKTPKTSRKRGRIATIPEDDVLQRENTTSNSTRASVEDKEMNKTVGRKSKRIASLRATDNIKKQKSLTLQIKQRKPTEENNSVPAKKVSSIIFTIFYCVI